MSMPFLLPRSRLLVSLSLHKRTFMWYTCNMQQMHTTTNGPVTPETCSALVLDVVPLAMRVIRQRMRAERAADLSVPQFRALGFMRRHAPSSLSDVAEHLGLTLSATSRLVDGLVARGLVVREPDPADRRYVTLLVSAHGVALVDDARERTQAALTTMIAGLSAEEQLAITVAMRALERVLIQPSASTPPDLIQGEETNNDDER